MRELKAGCFAVLALAFALSSCAPVPAATAAQGTEWVRHVYHGTPNQGQVGAIQGAIDQETSELFERLRIAPSNARTVTVEYWQDEEAYQQAMEPDLGARAPGSRGYITGPANVRVLVTGRLQAPREAVHEVVHALTLQLNPDFGNNPRWLWEASAQYFAGEQRGTNRIRAGLQEGCPSMKVLNAPFDRGGSIYRFGYTLADEVVHQASEEGLLALIKSNGDTQAVLGISLDVFHTRWCERLRTQVGFSSD